METSALFTTAAIISAFFGACLWTIIFLNTYMHFPKMEKKERIKLAVSNATIPTVLVLAIILLSLWLILGEIQ